ncbi:hypothetical protein [Myxococcus stipitatus]|uniref:hypothetical protein n=1 Tax=Myxococcus stipitatus TaxID=83455 RepID=UPI0030CB8DA0
MLCFRVSLNGRYLTTAGVPGFGVVSTILTWVRRPHDESNANPELTLNVGGSAGGDFREFLTWYDAAVRAGDVLTVELREDVVADAPKERRRDEDAGLDEVSLL